MSQDERVKTVVRSLSDAEEICKQRGVLFTKLRRAILELLLAADGPVKAYDLIEKMREKGGRLTPATIYRTLDFLLQHGLAHRINALNAFVPCTGDHEEHSVLMFVCSECSHTEELDDPVLYETMRARFDQLGMSLGNNSIEIQGTCHKCVR